MSNTILPGASLLSTISNNGVSCKIPDDRKSGRAVSQTERTVYPSQLRATVCKKIPEMSYIASL
jgi:hypothetical protein